MYFSIYPVKSNRNKIYIVCHFSLTLKMVDHSFDLRTTMDRGYFWNAPPMPTPTCTPHNISIRHMINISDSIAFFQVFANNVEP